MHFLHGENAPIETIRELRHSSSMSDRGNELIRSRYEKLQRLRDQGVDPYPARFDRTHPNKQAVELFEKTETRLGNGARTDQVSIAGRIGAMRGMGKASFLDLRDSTGRLQVHLRSDILGTKYDLKESVKEHIIGLK